MRGLQLRLLGELEVRRGDDILELPPSRKTRGLLAYLALQARPLRREQLCELLWEIPDDPRGSLRWSLSKIRKLVDDTNHPRIVADRSNVSFDTQDVSIDLLELRRVAAAATHATQEELQNAIRDVEQEFLQGLDLADFHEFHAWCLGERERARRDRVAVLSELCRRLEDDPEQTLEYTAALAGLLPFDEGPRAALIRQLVRLGRHREAELQYRAGLDKLAELGVADSGDLRRALRPSPPPSTASGVTRASAVPAHGLVGRDREMAALRSWFEEPAGARVVLIRGEPGMGKSRLLQAAASMAREAGSGLLKASAFESELMRPFGVWNDALRRALPDNATSRLLGGGEQVSRQQVFESLEAVLRDETAAHPVVALCDDVHWADEASVTAMHYVVRNNRRKPLLVVATSREAELRSSTTLQQVLRALRDEGLLQELSLEPLSSEQIRQLVEQQFPGFDGGTLAAEVGGNPLLAVELARAGMEGGGSLAELVLERKASLGEEAQDLLAWAAVLAPRISVRSLAQASGQTAERIDDVLERAEQLGLLTPGERGLRFSHELIRRAVYESISPSRRYAMHRRTAELLEVEAAVDLDLAADLAHHARLSGDPLMAGRAMVGAARLCLRFYANEEALALFREGLEFAAQLADAQRICLTLELEEIRMNALPAGEEQGLVEELVGLAEQAMDHGSRPHARLGYQMASSLRWMRGEISAARRFSLQAERVSRGASEEEHTQGLAETAKCLALLERDLSRADAMAMEARALAQRANYECTAVPLTLGILRYYEGRFEDAIDWLEEARAMAKSEGDRFSEFMTNEYLAMVEIERGDCASAARHTRALVEIGERLREGSERPYAEALARLCAFGHSGDDSGLGAALDALRRADAKQRLAFVLNRAALHYLELGQAQQARACAREALSLARLMERPSEELQALLTLERVHHSDRSLEPGTLRPAIEAVAAAGVAGWARQRCERLLTETA